MKEFFNKILFPNKIIGFLIFNIAFGLLIFVFSCHLEYSPIAYISYVLSFYALIIFCIWFYKVCKFSNEAIKKNKYYRLYKKYSLLITKILLYFSLSTNLIYGLFKLGTGIYYKSWWFITFAIYYLLLCFMKSSIVKHINNNGNITLKKEYEKLKSTGITLLFFNLLLTIIIILIIRQNQVISYNGFLIYLVALYDFYLIISAIINVIKYRKEHSPLIAATKCISLTVAMISMVSLEVAMVYHFGNNDTNFKLIMTGSMGFVICIINSIMSIYMIVKANKYLRK